MKTKIRQYYKEELSKLQTIRLLIFKCRINYYLCNSIFINLILIKIKTMKKFILLFALFAFITTSFAKTVPTLHDGKQVTEESTVDNSVTVLVAIAVNQEKKITNPLKNTLLKNSDIVSETMDKEAIILQTDFGSYRLDIKHFNKKNSKLNSNIFKVEAEADKLLGIKFQ